MDRIRNFLRGLSFLIIILICLTGCLSLKTDYPKINFYQLSDENLTKKTEPLNAILQIKDFSSSTEYETDQLLARINDNQIQRYYYHRWNVGPSEMITDYLVNHFNRTGVFTGGVIKTVTLMLPDYILEGQILEWMAYNNSQKETYSNFVVISIRINLIKFSSEKKDKGLLFNKVYEQKIPRENSSAETIAGAFSKGLSIISDELFADIKKYIPQK